MALAVGADFASPEALFGHLMHRDALWNQQLNHYPFLDPAAERAFVVGPDGRRFVDEERGALVIGNRIARLDDPAGAWLILDRARWETDARNNQAVPPNPNLLVHGARVEVADDAATLARRTGLPGDALTATIAELNAALSGGRAAGLPVPRTGAPTPLRPPYVALPLAFGPHLHDRRPAHRPGRVVDSAPPHSRALRRGHHRRRARRRADGYGGRHRDRRTARLPGRRARRHGPQRRHHRRGGVERRLPERPSDRPIDNHDIL